MNNANISEHTPTPWHRNVSPAWKYPIYADRDGSPNGKNWIHVAAVLPSNPNAEADLDFIVRAVNAYERDQEIKKELLDVAKWALKELLDSESKDLPGIQNLRQAIAHASGSESKADPAGREEVKP